MLKNTCENAIKLWEQASGTYIDLCSSIFSLDPNWNVKHVSRMLSQLRNEPHGEQLCLNVLSINYAPLTEYLQNLESLTPEMRDAHRQLGQLLAEPETKTFLSGAKFMIETLLQRLKKTLTLADTEYVQTLPLHVLQNADKSFESMKKMQWSSGIVQGDLGYNNIIPLFDSVDYLTQALSWMPNGFTLSAILEDNPADSYFVLVFKCFDHVVLLTDKPNYSDPLMASRLASRNQRYNAERLQNSYLPYHLLELTWDDNNRQVYSNATMALSAQNKPRTHRVLGFISDLPNDTLLWLSRLADLCVDQYRNGQSEPSVALLPSCAEESNNHGAIVLSDRKTTITLPELSQLTREHFTEAFPASSKSGGRRQWMVDAFAKDIPMSSLFPDETSLQQKIPALELRRSTPSKKDVNHQVVNIQLMPLPSKHLYTAEEAGKTAMYIGRHNLASIVEGRVFQDFVYRRDKIISWVYLKIIDNLDNLLPALLKLEHEVFSMHQHPGACRILDKTELVRQVHFAKCTQRWFKPQDASSLIRFAKLLDGNEACCYLQKHAVNKKVRSDHRFILNISNIFDLMNITGLSRDAFPECLQQYGLPQNLGNTTLNTVDPVDLMLDPWNSLVFTFSLPVSRTAVNRHRKALGLDPIPDAKSLPNYWDKTPEAFLLYASLRQNGFQPVGITQPPAFIYHESSEQRQRDVSTLDRQRRFAKMDD